MNKRTVKIAQLANNKSPFIEWMNSRDNKTKIKAKSILQELRNLQ